MLDAVWRFLKDLGEVILASMFSFAAAGARRMAEEGGELLIQVVQDAVNAADASEEDGLAKYKAAKEAAEDKLQAEGLNVATSTLNFAIEAAVANLKEGVAELQLRESMDKAE